MKKRKIVSISLIFCVILFALTGCSKKLKPDQISYKEQVISLGMEKEEIDALLGEGVQLEDDYISVNKKTGKEIRGISIVYDNIEISYIGYVNEADMFAAYIYIYIC